MNKSTRKLVLMGLFIAIAIALNYFERFIPIVITIPGVRLGLANVVTLVGLSILSVREVFVILIMRTVLSSLFYGSLSALMFSLGGGLLALIVMAILWRYKDRFISTLGISVAGALAHNIGQVSVAYFILNTSAIFGYLAILLGSAVITGILIGVVAVRTSQYLLRHYRL